MKGFFEKVMILESLKYFFKMWFIISYELGGDNEGRDGIIADLFVFVNFQFREGQREEELIDECDGEVLRVSGEDGDDFVIGENQG